LANFKGNFGILQN